MPILQVKESFLVAVPAPEEVLNRLGRGSTLEEEIDFMVEALQSTDAGQPDQVIAMCMALMGRCTEIYLKLVRIENDHRKAKAFRTMQLQKVMDLIDFYSRGASRLVEVRRQEVELSR